MNNSRFGFDFRLNMVTVESHRTTRAMPGNGRIMVEALARHAGSDPVAAAICQHADMVYATCRRMLGNEADAADVAQETFFQFLKQANRIRGSVAGWLHQVATRRSIDLIRQSASRRRREEAYAAETPSGEAAWQDIEPLVDEAIEALDPEARDLLLLHFLEGHSMAQIGAAKGISQPTVSRRIDGALEELRALLRGKGVMLATATLGGCLISSAQAAPAPLMLALGKMALAHVAASGGGVAAAGSTSLSGAKLAAVVAAGSLLVGTGWWLRPRPAPEAPMTNMPSPTVSFGFSTSVVWTTGPGARPTRIMSSGTNFAVTNFGPPIGVPPARER